MGIRASIGLALSIIVLKVLMGDAFAQFEHTLTQFFVLSGDLIANVSQSY
jgi:hypothetical protein